MQYYKNILCRLEKYDLGFIIDDNTDDFYKDKEVSVVKTIHNSSLLIYFQETGLRPEDHIKKKKEKQSTHIHHSLAKK